MKIDGIKVEKLGKSKNGSTLALCLNGENSWVWIRKVNYKLGKLRASWCYLAKRVNEDDAIKVFNRRNIDQ